MDPKSLVYIHPDARIADDVIIEPFTTIAADVEIGSGTWIGPNVTIMDGARIGKDCRIFPGAVISSVPPGFEIPGGKDHLRDRRPYHDPRRGNRQPGNPGCRYDPRGRRLSADGVCARSARLHPGQSCHPGQLRRPDGALPGGRLCHHRRFGRYTPVHPHRAPMR